MNRYSIILCLILVLGSCDIIVKDETNEEKAESLIIENFKKSGVKLRSKNTLALKMDSVVISAKYDSESWEIMDDILKLVDKGKAELEEIEDLQNDMDYWRGTSSYYKKYKNEYNEHCRLLKKIRENLSIQVQRLQNRDSILAVNSKRGWIVYYKYEDMIPIVIPDMENEYTFIISEDFRDCFGDKKTDVDDVMEKMEIVLKASELEAILDEFETLALYD